MRGCWVKQMYNERTAERQKRYRQTEKGKLANRRSTQKYDQSEKGKLSHRERNKRHYAKLKDQRLAQEVTYDS